MRLCLISSMFPLPGESPSLGPDNVVFNLAKGLIKIDDTLSIDIVTIRNDIKKLYTHSVFNNVTVHYYPRVKFLPRSIGDPFIIKKVIKKNDFDLIHSHSSISLSRILNMNIPKILTLHGIYWREKNFIKSSLIKFFFYDYNTYMFKKTLGKIDAFVAISPYILDELENMNLQTKVSNVFQINNPIDPSFFSTSFDKKNKNMIFYPSAIRFLKNQKTAINATNIVKKEINDVKLIFAGSIFEQEYFQQLKDEINNNDLFDNVEYVGKVSRTEMLKLYEQSSIVYLLSYHESFSMVVAEAMATGNVVIASNLKPISYLVEDTITGYLVNPNDSKKVAEYTLELLKDEKKRKLMGNNAREMMKLKCNSDAIAKQTLEMYYKVLNSSLK